MYIYIYVYVCVWTIPPFILNTPKETMCFFLRGFTQSRDCPGARGLAPWDYKQYWTILRQVGEKSLFFCVMPQSLAKLVDISGLSKVYKWFTWIYWRNPKNEQRFP